MEQEIMSLGGEREREYWGGGTNSLLGLSFLSDLIKFVSVNSGACASLTYKTFDDVNTHSKFLPLVKYLLLSLINIHLIQSHFCPCFIWFRRVVILSL